MDNKSEQQADIGVIIGRFQVHDLHASQVEMIESVMAKHRKVVLFLGVSPTLVTKRNPLDFVSRKEMILARFPQLTVLALPDVRSDQEWSITLDRRIREVLPVGKIMLYGRREGVLERYRGEFPTNELEPTTFVSGTEVRKNVSNEVMTSRDFRAGVIYAAYNQYDKVFAAVEVAVLKGHNILLARKPTENELRFIGGFTLPDDNSFEDTVRREVRTEACIEVHNIRYVGSAKIDDWRYREESDKIISLLYVADYAGGHIEPNDDISELRLVPIHEFSASMLVEEHRSLYNLLNSVLMFQQGEIG